MPKPSQLPGLERALADLPERFPRRRKYLVGVSGGQDSVALLDLLVRLGYRRLVVAHLNHGLRGRTSGQDAAFVRRLAASYGLDAVVEKRAVSGSEDSGRRARMAFFAEHGSRVFLAHHADDQVETVVMNFLRGAGTGGLGGMREVSRNGKVELIRPLLEFARGELAAYAIARGLPFREDASNAGRDFLRNRVRHDLLPLARAVMRREIRGAILRGAAIAREDDALAGELSVGMLANILEVDGSLATRALLASPVAVQRRVIREWLVRAGATDVGFDEVETVRRIADPRCTTARHMMPGALQIRRCAGHLRLVPAAPARPE